MIELTIPLPPSANSLFATVQRGRHRRTKTRRYRHWIEQAGWQLLLQRPQPIPGRYRLTIVLPRIIGDPDNRVKAISDLLVTHGIIKDDSAKFCAGITVTATQERSAHALVLLHDEGGGYA